MEEFRVAFEEGDEEALVRGSRRRHLEDNDGARGDCQDGDDGIRGRAGRSRGGNRYRQTVRTRQSVNLIFVETSVMLRRSVGGRPAARGGLTADPTDAYH